MKAIVKWALLAVAIVGALAALAAFGTMAFVFSIGTAMIEVAVDATVREKETGRPVPGCLLAFEKDANGGYGQTAERTDAQGRSQHVTSHSFVGSMFLAPFERARKPKLRFYLGEAPQYGVYDDVETWDVALSFEEPWTRREVVPRIELQRNVVYDDAPLPSSGEWRRKGSRPLPAAGGESPLEARVRFESNGRGGERYRVLLSVALDGGQIAACRGHQADATDDAPEPPPALIPEPPLRRAGPARAATAVPPAALRVGGPIAMPKKLRHVEPDLPPVERGGTVILECTVGLLGKVVDVRILRGHSAPVDEAVEAAARRWVYAPTLVNGIPVSVLLTETVTVR
jgi:TonB family protein